jgi:hypothetical protein
VLGPQHRTDRPVVRRPACRLRHGRFDARSTSLSPRPPPCWVCERADSDCLLHRPQDSLVEGSTYLTQAFNFEYGHVVSRARLSLVDLAHADP